MFFRTQICGSEPHFGQKRSLQISGKELLMFMSLEKSTYLLQYSFLNNLKEEILLFKVIEKITGPISNYQCCLPSRIFGLPRFFHVPAKVFLVPLFLAAPALSTALFPILLTTVLKDCSSHSYM